MSDLPKDMEHVDRRELYTSLPVRIQYLQQFLEFTAGNQTPYIWTGLELFDRRSMERQSAPADFGPIQMMSSP
jgi:hypothetical protein